MKVFNLKCEDGHGFEGWFASHKAFADQHAKNLLQCPICGSNQVQKALSAPRLNLSAGAPGTALRAPGPSAEGASGNTAAAVSASGGHRAHGAALPADPEQARALASMLTAVRELLSKSEDVGNRFAEEARAMHAEEIPHRSIHGETSAEEAQELIEEGIPVLPIPFGKLFKTPLQ